jgi:hypothetical protein
MHDDAMVLLVVVIPTAAVVGFVAYRVLTRRGPARLWTVPAFLGATLAGLGLKRMFDAAGANLYMVTGATLFFVTLLFAAASWRSRRSQSG